jgi:BioD-like phosphotransacetylase family protein
MAQKTNNQFLQEILESQKKQAVELFQLAADLSIYTNKTEARFDEILSLLESNDKTKQKGVIEQLSLNTEHIANIKTDMKIDKKLVYAFGIAFVFLFNFVVEYFWK